MDAAQKFAETLKIASEQPGAGLSYEKVARWLPFSVDSLTVENFLGNVTLYPQSMPLTTRELFFYQAMIREIFRKVWQSEGLNLEQNMTFTLPAEIAKFARNDREAILLFLDAVAPEGIIDLLGPSQEKLATLFSFSTPNIQSGVIAKVKIDTGLAQAQKLSLKFGDLVLIPSEREEKIELTIDCEQKVRIGKAARVKVVTTTGLVGLVFDCRGRPFIGPDLTLASRELVKSWHKKLGIEPSF